MEVPSTAKVRVMSMYMYESCSVEMNVCLFVSQLCRNCCSCVWLSLTSLIQKSTVLYGAVSHGRAVCTGDGQSGAKEVVHFP